MISNQKRTYLTEDEADRVIKAARAEGRQGVRDHTLLQVTYRHGLRACRLLIDFDTAEARQEIGDLTWNQMRAIQFRGHLDRQAQVRPGWLHQRAFRNRPHEVSAQTYEGLDCAV